MYLKKLPLLLIIILVMLVIIATVSTFFVSDVTLVNESKGNVSIAVTGDIMFARNMPNVLSFDSSPFNGVSNVTSNVDLLLINFENAATTSSDAVKGDVPLKCDPSYVKLAKANNITVAALANNHALDYGIDGMKDTINVLKDNGITPIGAGENEHDAHESVSKIVNGRNITIFNYMDSNNFKEYSYEVMPYANGSSPGYSAYDSIVAKQDISNAKANGSDYVIAYVHFGNEYSNSPNDDQKQIAHELIDDGADIVIGAHPHVTQGIEMYNGKAIFYSLGNFIFDQSNTATHSAYFIKIDLVNNTANCTIYPIYISNYLPQFMSSSDGINLIKELNPQCENLIINDDGTGTLKYNLDNNSSM